MQLYICSGKILSLFFILSQRDRRIFTLLMTVVNLFLNKHLVYSGKKKSTRVYIFLLFFFLFFFSHLL